MFGFWWIEQIQSTGGDLLPSRREGMGADQLSTTPAWFGQTVTSFAEVGQHISEDPRFRQCAVQQFAQSLLNRPMDATDYEILDSLREHFERNLLQIKPLVAAITQTPEYRSASPLDQHADIRTIHFLTPELLRSSVKDLTSYDWLSFEIPTSTFNCERWLAVQMGFRPSAHSFPSLTTSLVGKKIGSARIDCPSCRQAAGCWKKGFLKASRRTRCHQNQNSPQSSATFRCGFTAMRPMRLGLSQSPFCGRRPISLADQTLPGKRSSVPCCKTSTTWDIDMWNTNLKLKQKTFTETWRRRLFLTQACRRSTH